MKQITLTGKGRVLGKKSDNKNLRKSGNVPCILYGVGVENIIFSVDAKELKKVTNTPNSYIIELDIEGKKHLAVFHDAQWHPVSDECIHVDFLAVSEDKPVAIDVPVSVSGHAEGVKQGGKLYTGARKLRVSGLIKDLPDILPIDVSPLTLGKQINAGDLHFDGIKILTPKTTMIAAVRVTRAVVEEETPAATEAAAPAEGAAAPAAEEKK